MQNTDKKKEKFPIEVKPVITKKRDEVLNVNGWGFKDTYFTSKDGFLQLSGKRYPISGLPFINARKHMMDLTGKDVKIYKPIGHPSHRACDYPPGKVNEPFCADLKKSNIDFSTDFDDRFHRCHGQAMKDLYIIRYKKFDRVPDIVAWPKSHDDVVTIVELANKYLCVIVPFGGGTNTMLSLNHSKDDSRFFISLDTTQMNKILWIDRKSMLACMEAGIVGMDMERALQKEGLTVGHEPDSIELSTLGGWVATRSSGMKQQTYGNIEQIVNKITLVTSVGVLEKSFIAPRVSIGPDFHQIVLGSEGTLGVVTKVIVKVHNKPEVRYFGSIAFHSFEIGTRFMYDVSKFTVKPSSLRLVDSYHTKIGLAFQRSHGAWDDFKKFVKAVGMVAVYGLDINKLALVTYLIESDKASADKTVADLMRVAKKHGGVDAGSDFGKQVHVMTLVVCYVRDLFFNLGFLYDSLETSISWKNLLPLITTLREAWDAELKDTNILNAFGMRISQIYHDGACVYLYFGIGETKNQYELFEKLNKMVKGTMLNCGATLSHHHGVGQKNKEFYPQSVSKVGVDMLNAIKAQLDPNNVFGISNMLPSKY